MLKASFVAAICTVGVVLAAAGLGARASGGQSQPGRSPVSGLVNRHRTNRPTRATRASETWQVVVVTGQVSSRRTLTCPAQHGAGTEAFCTALGQLRNWDFSPPGACRHTLAAVAPQVQRTWVTYVRSRRDGRFVDKLNLQPIDWCGSPRFIEKGPGDSREVSTRDGADRRCQGATRVCIIDSDWRRHAAVVRYRLPDGRALG